jgi:hypothetical protein
MTRLVFQSQQTKNIKSNGYNPFLYADRISVEIGFTDPVFRAKFKKEHSYDVDEDAKTHPVDIEGGSLSKAAQEWTKIDERQVDSVLLTYTSRDQQLGCT